MQNKVFEVKHIFWKREPKSLAIPFGIIWSRLSFIIHLLYFFNLSYSYYDFFETKASTENIHKLNSKHRVFRPHIRNVQKHAKRILKRKLCGLKWNGNT